MPPRIPYGISHFSRIREAESLFVDHTRFIWGLDIGLEPTDQRGRFVDAHVLRETAFRL